jgi:hypothetical protein
MSMPIVRCDRCHEGSHVLFGQSRVRNCNNCGAPIDPWAPRIADRSQKAVSPNQVWTVRVNYATADLIEIGGPLTSTGVGVVRRALEASMTRAAVVVNLAYCDFIDRSGVALLKEAPSILEPGGTRFAIAAARGRVEWILGLAGIDRNLAVFPDAAAALRNMTPLANA